MKARSRFFKLYAKAKVYGDVSRYYIAVPTFVLVLINHVRNSDYSTLVAVLIYTLFPLLLILIVHLHIKFIMPEEMRYLSLKNPVTKQLLKNTGNGKVDE